MAHSPTMAAMVLASILLIGSGALTVPMAPPSGHPAASAAIHPVSSVPSTSSATGASLGMAHALAVEKALRAKDASSRRINLPDFAAEVSDRDRTISPGQVTAPIPMGLSDVGLRNVSGSLQPYLLNTTSVAGTVNITNLQSVYVDGDGPDTYGIQENSVAAGVTLFGQTGYQFWSQNYVDYTPSTRQLVFGDEVWNFSNPSGNFPASSVYAYSPNGTLEFLPEVYQGYGPSITIGYPFSLTLYLNTTDIADRPAFFFNYTVANATWHQSASFDYLIFNSTVGTPTGPAPVPVYQADGYQYDPIGLINDMEIDILGNDDGDIATFYEANATLSLEYYDATTRAMEEVPSAFNVGQETGESSNGLAVFSSGGAHPIAEVRTGPSFARGLWNYSGSPGDVALTLHLDPTNAFLFVNPGVTEVDSQAQWVPTFGGNPTRVYVPEGGTYYLHFLLSDYNATGQTWTASTSTSLTVILLPWAPAGIYTPLFAWGDAELPSISVAGSGTAVSPYVLESAQYVPLDPVFAQWDDYLWPVFPGLLLADTTAWVTVVPASFSIDIPAYENPGAYGLPSTNDLELQLYDTSNVSLVNAPSISGWAFAALATFPVASVILWGDSNDLLANDYFADQGSALAIYGGSDNTFWGNTFQSASVSTSGTAPVYGSGNGTMAFQEAEAGDLIYNNFLSVPVPAQTLPYDPFLCGQYGYCGTVLYHDAWNVSVQPAGTVHVVNGWNLSGSILGTSWQGGNYWSNYGTASNPYGVLPYNDSGLIQVGGDYHPLIPSTLYEVTFEASGVSLPVAWTVTTEGVTSVSNTSQLTVLSPNGTFAFSVQAPAGFLVNDSGNFTVSGASISVPVVFTPLEGVAFEPSGLRQSAEWSVTLWGPGTDEVPETQNSTGDLIGFSVPLGPYEYSVSAPGYKAVPASGNLTVTLTGVVQPVVFSIIPGALALTVTPVTATVWVGGYTVSLSSGGFEASLVPGLYAIEATDGGYAPYFNNVSVAGGATTVLTIALEKISNSTAGKTPPNATAKSTTAPLFSSTALAVVGALAVVAVLLLIGLLYFATRGAPRPRPPSPGESPEGPKPSEPGPLSGEESASVGKKGE